MSLSVDTLVISEDQEFEGKHPRGKGGRFAKVTDYATTAAPFESRITASPDSPDDDLGSLKAFEAIHRGVSGVDDDRNLSVNIVPLLPISSAGSSEVYGHLSVLEAKSYKAHVTSTLAQDSGVSEYDVNAFIHEWARTSNKSWKAVAAQVAAHQLFGAPLSKWQKKMRMHYEYGGKTILGAGDTDFPSSDNEYYDYVETAKIILSAMYNRTQKLLRSAGVKSLVAYRGVKGERTISAEVGNEPRIFGNCMESWTFSKSMGSLFSKGMTGSGDYTKPGVVLKAEIPVERILATPRTGYGCLKELELVVLSGKKDTATVAEKNYNDYVPHRGVPYAELFGMRDVVQPSTYFKYVLNPSSVEELFRTAKVGYSHSRDDMIVSWHKLEPLRKSLEPFFGEYTDRMLPAVYYGKKKNVSDALLVGGYAGVPGYVTNNSSLDSDLVRKRQDMTFSDRGAGGVLNMQFGVGADGKSIDRVYIWPDILKSQVYSMEDYLDRRLISDSGRASDVPAYLLHGALKKLSDMGIANDVAVHFQPHGGGYAGVGGTPEDIATTLSKPSVEDTWASDRSPVVAHLTKNGVEYTDEVKEILEKVGRADILSEDEAFEQKHPRGKGGRFAKSNSGSAPTSAEAGYSVDDLRRAVYTNLLNSLVLGGAAPQMPSVNEYAKLYAPKLGVVEDSAFNHIYSIWGDTHNHSSAWFGLQHAAVEMFDTPPTNYLSTVMMGNASADGEAVGRNIFSLLYADTQAAIAPIAQHGDGPKTVRLYRGVSNPMTAGGTVEGIRSVRVGDMDKNRRPAETWFISLAAAKKDLESVYGNGALLSMDVPVSRIITFGVGSKQPAVLIGADQDDVALDVTSTFKHVISAPDTLVTSPEFAITPTMDADLIIRSDEESDAGGIQVLLDMAVQANAKFGRPVAPEAQEFWEKSIAKYKKILVQGAVNGMVSDPAGSIPLTDFSTNMSVFNNDSVRQATKMFVVAGIHNQLIMPSSKVNRIIGTWAESSNKTEESIRVQLAAHLLFGAGLHEWQIRTIWDRLGLEKDELDGVDAFAETKTERVVLSKMYEITQKVFSDAGINTVRLYRGVSGGAYDIGDADVVAAKSNALESWSVSPEVATGFVDESRYIKGPVLVADVPVERILCTATTGMGCLAEYEMVVLGGGEHDKFSVYKQGADPTSLPLADASVVDLHKMCHADKSLRTDCLAMRPYVKYSDEGMYMFMRAFDHAQGFGFMVVDGSSPDESISAIYSKASINMMSARDSGVGFVGYPSTYSNTWPDLAKELFYADTPTLLLPGSCVVQGDDTYTLFSLATFDGVGTTEKLWSDVELMTAGNISADHCLEKNVANFFVAMAVEPPADGAHAIRAVYINDGRAMSSRMTPEYDEYNRKWTVDVVLPTLRQLKKLGLPDNTPIYLGWNEMSSVSDDLGTLAQVLAGVEQDSMFLDDMDMVEDDAFEQKHPRNKAGRFSSKTDTIDVSGYTGSASFRWGIWDKERGIDRRAVVAYVNNARKMVPMLRKYQVDDIAYALRIMGGGHDDQPYVADVEALGTAMCKYKSDSDLVKKLKGAVVDSLASDTGLPYEIVNATVASWAWSANDSLKTSLASQVAVSNLFGVPLSEWQQEKLNRVLEPEKYGEPVEGPLHGADIFYSPEEAYYLGRTFEQMVSDSEKIVSAMYTRTQAFLKDSGIDELVVFRGMNEEGFSQLHDHEEVRPSANSVESWSLDDFTAERFMSRYKTVGDDLVKVPGAVLAMRVPAERVLCMPSTGFGCLGEFEVLLVGNAYDRCVVHKTRDLSESDSEFEQKHPRGKGGRFAKKGTGAYSAGTGKPLDYDNPGTVGRDGYNWFMHTAGSMLKEEIPGVDRLDTLSAAGLLSTHSVTSDYAAFQDDTLERAAEPIVRQAVKIHIARYLSDATGIGYDTVCDYIRLWAASSNKSPESAAVQYAAHEVFGVPLDKWQKDNISSLKFRPEFMSTLEDSRKLLPAMYARTQEMFRDAGVSKLLLYRGVKREDFLDVAYGTHVHVKGNAVESWAFLCDTAAEFAQGGSGGALVKPGLVLAMEVPVERVLCTSLNGFGCFIENEVCLLSSAGDSAFVIEQYNNDYPLPYEEEVAPTIDESIFQTTPPWSGFSLDEFLKAFTYYQTISPWNFDATGWDDDMGGKSVVTDPVLENVLKDIKSNTEYDNKDGRIAGDSHVYYPAMFFGGETPATSRLFMQVKPALSVDDIGQTLFAITGFSSLGDEHTSYKDFEKEMSSDSNVPVLLGYNPDTGAIDKVLLMQDTEYLYHGNTFDYDFDKPDTERTVNGLYHKLRRMGITGDVSVGIYSSENDGSAVDIKNMPDADSAYQAWEHPDFLFESEDFEQKHPRGKAGRFSKKRARNLYSVEAVAGKTDYMRRTKKDVSALVSVFGAMAPVVIDAVDKHIAELAVPPAHQTTQTAVHFDEPSTRDDAANVLLVLNKYPNADVSDTAYSVLKRWENVGIRSSMKKEIAEELTARIRAEGMLPPKIPAMEISKVVSDWASSNVSRDSAATHVAASRLFGTPIRKYQEPFIAKARLDAGYMWDERVDIAEAVLKASYDRTQEIFKKAGIKEVTVYRGVRMPNFLSDVPEKGNTRNLESNPLEAWSFSMDIAQRFADGTWMTGAHLDDYPAVVYRMTVPVERIVSSSISGLGCLPEGEVLLSGNEFDQAKVVFSKRGNMDLVPPMVEATDMSLYDSVVVTFGGVFSAMDYRTYLEDSVTVVGGEYADLTGVGFGVSALKSGHGGVPEMFGRMLRHMYELPTQEVAKAKRNGTLDELFDPHNVRLSGTAIIEPSVTTDAGTTTADSYAVFALQPDGSDGWEGSRLEDMWYDIEILTAGNMDGSIRDWANTVDFSIESSVHDLSDPRFVSVKAFYLTDGRLDPARREPGHDAYVLEHNKKWANSAVETIYMLINIGGYGTGDEPIYIEEHTGKYVGQYKKDVITKYVGTVSEVAGATVEQMLTMLDNAVEKQAVPVAEDDRFERLHPRDKGGRFSKKSEEPVLAAGAVEPLNYRNSKDYVDALLLASGIGSSDDVPESGYYMLNDPTKRPFVWHKDQIVYDIAAADDDWNDAVAKGICRGDIELRATTSAYIYKSAGLHGMGFDGETWYWMDFPPPGSSMEKQGQQLLPMPDRLYHVTTAFEKIEKDGGVLKSRHDLAMYGRAKGLGGGSERTISFTGSYNVAFDIVDVMGQAARFMQGDTSLYSLAGWAAEGYKSDRPYLRDWVKLSTGIDDWPNDDSILPQKFQEIADGCNYICLRPGDHPDDVLIQHRDRNPKLGGKPSADNMYGEWEIVNRDVPGISKEGKVVWQRTMARSDLLDKKFRIFEEFLSCRQTAGGQLDPLFWGTDPEYFADLDYKDLAILTYEPANDRCMGVRLAGLDEWRVFGGEALRLKNVQRPFLPPEKVANQISVASAVQPPSVADQVEPSPDTEAVRGHVPAGVTSIDKKLDISDMPGDRSRLGKAVRGVLSAINSTHGVSDLPRIPLKKTSGFKFTGGYAYNTRTGDAIRIQISSNATYPMNSLAHEIGHLIDHYGVDGHRLANFATVNEDTPILDDLKAALKNSKTFDRLQELSSSPFGTTLKIPFVSTKGDREIQSLREVSIDKMYVRYLMRMSEMFARGYAQYVAVRGGRDDMAQELDQIRQSEYPTQWEDDDFEPIAVEFDKLFEKMGWRI